MTAVVAVSGPAAVDGELSVVAGAFSRRAPPLCVMLCTLDALPAVPRTVVASAPHLAVFRFVVSSVAPTGPAGRISSLRVLKVVHVVVVGGRGIRGRGRGRAVVSVVRSGLGGLWAVWRRRAGCRVLLGVLASF